MRADVLVKCSSVVLNIRANAQQLKVGIEPVISSRLIKGGCICPAGNIVILCMTEFGYHLITSSFTVASVMYALAIYSEQILR